MKTETLSSVNKLLVVVMQQTLSLVGGWEVKNSRKHDLPMIGHPRRSYCAIVDMIEGSIALHLFTESAEDISRDLAGDYTARIVASKDYESISEFAMAWTNEGGSTQAWDNAVSTVRAMGKQLSSGKVDLTIPTILH